MFDAQCDLAALVYEQHQDPDRILHEFADDLNQGGYRAVGLVLLGHHGLDASLSAMLVHTGEKLQLLQSLGNFSTGCRLDVGQLPAAGQQDGSSEIEEDTDLLIVNRLWTAGARRQSHVLSGGPGAQRGYTSACIRQEQKIFNFCYRRRAPVRIFVRHSDLSTFQKIGVDGPWTTPQRFPPRADPAPLPERSIITW